MAETKEISVTVGVTKGLPNYSSVRYDAFKKVTLEPGDNEAEVWEGLWREVTALVEEQME